jgi:hypothetical protein
VATWDGLRVVLSKLAADSSRPLRAHPDPRADVGSGAPFAISLAAWAVDIATELTERFGADVDITVGYLHFPDGGYYRAGRPVAAARPPVEPLLSADEVSVSLDEPIEVKSGHDLRSVLRIRNHKTGEIVVRTNGQVTARIVDPASGEIVGGFAGSQRMPLISFRIAPGEQLPVPLLVGTASRVAALGYAVPPGQWLIEVPLELEDRGRYTTPHLPITVT